MDNLKEKILQAKAEFKPLYIPNAHEIRTTWDEYIALITHVRSELEMYCKCDSYVHKNSAFIGHDEDDRRILVYNNFDPVIFGCNHLFDAATKLEELLDNHDLKGGILKTIANIVGYENPSGVHPDSHDVISFPLLGSIEYRVFYDLPEGFDTLGKDLEYVSYDLHPGDLMYIPTGLHHQVIINEPRITAIFDFNEGIS